MKYFRVKNLERFQHYKDRKPVWIKLYASILNDDKFNGLSERQQLFWIKLLVYSSQNSNKIRYDSKSISNRLSFNYSISLEIFLKLDMIEIIEDIVENASKPLEPYNIKKSNINHNINQKDLGNLENPKKPEPRILSNPDEQILQLAADFENNNTPLKNLLARAEDMLQYQMTPDRRKSLQDILDDIAEKETR